MCNLSDICEDFCKKHCSKEKHGHCTYYASHCGETENICEYISLCKKHCDVYNHCIEYV